MKRKLEILLLIGALVLSAAPVWGEFYVIGGGGGVGTKITSLPYTINEAGFYYLGKNLTSASATDYAITVNVGEVTLDLMGFSITGPGKAGGVNHGVSLADNLSNVEIRNGSIKNFATFAIYGGTTTTGVRVIGIRVRDIGGCGLYLAGTDNLVMDCSAMSTGAVGIYAGNGALIKGNHVTNNNIGIGVTQGCTVMGNVAISNNNGIGAGLGSSVTDNSAFLNTNWGICAGSTCTITRNTTRSTAGVGIIADTYCTVTNNTTKGLTAHESCTVAGNTIEP